MPPASSLTQTVDTWTSQAMVASSYLVSLYRMLGDGRQAALALKARGPCEERAQRLGLQHRIAGLHATFVALNTEDVTGEACAWQWLVEAHAGLAVFHSLAGDTPGSAQGLRGKRTATLKALRHSMQGYRTAFPAEMADSGIHLALDAATAGCLEAFVLDAEDVPEPERLSLRQELQSIIRETFTQAFLEGV